MSNKYLWWQRGIIYQVYPRSFMDGYGDGIGDLRGVAARLDYLQWLGVDAIWISPFYQSPMADFGYDVSDYKGIHPMFGTDEDFDDLISKAHEREIRVILDFVPNHTSEEHPWFVESRSSRGNPKRDWYLWADPAPDGGPPNNWLSVFGGGAWEWDEATEQYYYHAYLKEQPDLNWRKPEVQKEMLDTMRFWLDRGVDGLRVDVIWHMIKDDQLRDNPPNPDHEPSMSPFESLLPVYTTDRPEVHDVVAMMRGVLDEYDERMMIGEMYLPTERLVTYYGKNGEGVHMPHNLQLIVMPWDARRIAATIDTYEGALPPGAWPNWVLGNHDKPRLATRVGPGQARVAAVLLLTLRGTPTLYYGDEIGMHAVDIPPDKVQDPWEKNVPGLGLGRDPSRTPMQWDGTPNAGFCPADVEPWLPVADDYEENNVQAESEDPESMLSLYRRLISLRRDEPALAVGSYAPVVTPGDLLAYVRENDGRKFLIVLNLGHEAQTFDPDERVFRGRVILGTHLDRDGEALAGALSVRGDEGLVVELTS